jgi:hypothetical protein
LVVEIKEADAHENLSGTRLTIQFNVKEDEHLLEVKKAGFVTDTKKFTYSKGTKENVVRVELKPEKPEHPVVGNWGATFKNGGTADFVFGGDHKVSGTNEFVGHWEQTNRRVTVYGKTPASPIVRKWEGEIDPTGQVMRLAIPDNSAIYVRK